MVRERRGTPGIAVTVLERTMMSGRRGLGPDPVTRRVVPRGEGPGEQGERGRAGGWAWRRRIEGTMMVMMVMMMRGAARGGRRMWAAPTQRAGGRRDRTGVLRVLLVRASVRSRFLVL